MRKMLKRKRRSCGLCKPHKIGGETRWRPREVQAMKLADKEMRNA